MATNALITVATGGAGKVFNKVASKVSQHLDDALDVGFLRISAKGEVGEALTHTPSRYSPDIPAEMQDNIDETLHYITNGAISKDVPKRIKQNWGKYYENRTGELPDLGKNGYKEYRVRGENKQDQLHRIVVGKDGNYYYTNTHYGQQPGQPFHYGEKLTPEQTKKIFRE